jgi:hypothetical protein
MGELRVLLEADKRRPEASSYKSPNGQAVISIHRVDSQARASAREGHQLFCRSAAITGSRGSSVA